MNHKVKKSTLTILILVTSFTCSKQALSAGMPVVDVPNLVQNTLTAKNAANSLLKQAEQIKYQLEMIKNQKEQLKQLKDYQWRDASQLFKELDNIQQQNQALSYGIKNWQQQFQYLYRDFAKTNQKLMNSYDSVQKQQQATLTSLESAVGVNQLAAKHSEEEQKLLKTINHQAQTATNSLQVTQAQTALQTENVQQLSTLKRVMIAHMNAEEAMMASQVSQQVYQDEQIHKMINSMPTEFPRYKENPAFGKILSK